MEYTPASIKGEHVVLTGPITGTVTLDDGTVVDVTQPVVGVESPERAAEIAHAVGLRYAEEGHPDDIEVDEESGELVQRPFDYVAPEDNTSKKKG